MERFERGQPQAMVVDPVEVIYVDAEPAPERRCGPVASRFTLLKLAARTVHHMADRVDELRRSLERRNF